ncbi:MAG: ATP citrate lyase [Nitrospirae bacterium]|nr:ATP citrate lyase [Nitrospirota bacterium]
MSIVANHETRVVIQGGPAGVNAARRMAEFCHLIQKPFYVEAFVFPPDAGKSAEVPFGNKVLSLPIYKSVADAVQRHPHVNTSLVYIAADRAYGAAMDALNADSIRVVSMITEGVPEKDAKLVRKAALAKGKIFNGPSSIGIISAGQCRLGVVGGAYDNLILSKLYRPGSYGVITKSGGLLNEIIWMCSQFADGITTAIGIGGDAYPGSDFVTFLDLFEKDPDTKAVVLVGEMGGNAEELAAEWLAAKPRRIKVVCVVAGFCQEHLPKGMKFGHAGAKEGMHGEGSARHKSEVLRKAGAVVPQTFGGLGQSIKEVYADLKARGKILPIAEPDVAALPKLPKGVEEAIKGGEVMAPPLLRSTICDDRGDEPMYLGYPASELIAKGYDIPHVIGLLWVKRLLTDIEAELVKRILILSADHGPCVSGALTTIIGANAGIPLSQAVASGISMIGPRFGGAVTDAGRWFKFALAQGMTPQEFVDYMKKNVGPIPGIGHRVKSLRNPDKRVAELIAFVKTQPIKTPHLDFALEVEKITTAKKDTLILNLDGTIACVLVDLGFPEESLNGFFILARTIGLIGHWIDQRQQDARMIRLPLYLAHYDTEPKREAPPRGK